MEDLTRERALRIAADPETVRRRRLREDGKRPLSVNLAETIELSRKLHLLAGAARKK